MDVWMYLTGYPSIPAGGILVSHRVIGKFLPSDRRYENDGPRHAVTVKPLFFRKNQFLAWFKKITWSTPALA